MNRFLASLKDKRFRYGSFSTAMILFAVILFILVNLVAGQFNVSRDLTRDKMYSLSSYTKEFLATLDKDVTIYALFPTGQENLMFKQLLEEYASSSPRVSVVYRDPLLYPSFVESYAKPDERIENNSVIVECGAKYKVIQASQMVTYEYDYNTWQQYVASIDIEPQVSNAINYVTLGDTPVIYRVTGSNEYALPAELINQIEMANYTVSDVNLVTDELPADCAMLLVTPPSRDWSTYERDKILDYLQHDGKALFVLGPMLQRFPNVDAVLEAYGVAVGNYFVVEGDSRYYYPNTPIMLFPGYVPNEITQSFIDRNYPVMAYLVTGVDELPIKKANTQIEPLLVTTSASYGKSNPEAATLNKEPTDVDGPFSLAVAITDTYYTETTHTTKLVVTGCESLLDDTFNSAVGGTNWEFLVNSVKWLHGQDTSIYIPSKNPNTSMQQLTMTMAQAGMLALFAAVILPVGILIIGLVVWFRRRHS